MNRIPIVFAFDDNYALPASIAVASLVEAKKQTTEYDIYVLHSGLSELTQKKMEKIHPIHWIQVNANQFKDVPKGWSGLETYYRLIVHDLLPQHDKIIWSDVDVLFRTDLSDIFEIDLTDYYWAGVIAEKACETNGIHTRFEENKNEYIYMPGFMVINSKKMRQEHMTKTFFDIIRRFGARLKMFDLDVLNLACPQIKAVPFDYCVLENIYDSDNIQQANEYPWLSKVYQDDELIRAKNNPAIIHYAGRSVKIWKRSYGQIPSYYWKYIESSLFYKKENYFFTGKMKLKVWGLSILIKLTPIKKWNKKLKEKKNFLRRFSA